MSDDGVLYLDPLGREWLTRDEYLHRLEHVHAPNARRLRHRALRLWCRITRRPVPADACYWIRIVQWHQWEDVGKPVPWVDWAGLR